MSKHSMVKRWRIYRMLNTIYLEISERYPWLYTGHYVLPCKNMNAKLYDAMMQMLALMQKMPPTHAHMNMCPSFSPCSYRKACRSIVLLPARTRNTVSRPGQSHVLSSFPEATLLCPCLFSGPLLSAGIERLHLHHLGLPPRRMFSA